MRLILAITGASGMPIALRTAQLLSEEHEIHLIISEAAKKVMNYELEDKKAALEQLEDTCEAVYSEGELEAPIASGSYKTDAMIIVPCSMKTLGSLAAGVPDNLIGRAADVCLKERRKLILVPRETPLNSFHLENMLKLSKNGVDIIPPMLGFYFDPETKQDLIDYVVGKIVARLGLEHDLYPAWQEGS